ncbi:hypothetical protein L1887_11612 [Cichorium endivia]|nr:hypothetical protein L1887_11612 [Cichorium endivia]
MKLKNLRKPLPFFTIASVISYISTTRIPRSSPFPPPSTTTAYLEKVGAVILPPPPTPINLQHDPTHNQYCDSANQTVR